MWKRTWQPAAWHLCSLDALNTSGTRRTWVLVSSAKRMGHDLAAHTAVRRQGAAQELAPDTVVGGNPSPAVPSRFGGRQPAPRTAFALAPYGTGRNLARLV